MKIHIRFIWNMKSETAWIPFPENKEFTHPQLQHNRIDGSGKLADWKPQYKGNCQRSALLFVALGFNKTELITPSQCTEVIHYKFEGNQEGTYNIRICPKAFPDQAFPDVCELVFTAFDPWNDMLFSFSHCDIGKDGPCKEEDTRYSHIREDSLIVSIANEDTLMLVSSSIIK